MFERTTPCATDAIRSVNPFTMPACVDPGPDDNDAIAGTRTGLADLGQINISQDALEGPAAHIDAML